MSLFERADLVAQFAHSKVFGEFFLFIPMDKNQDVNAPMIKDSARQSIIITGIYKEMDANPNIPDAPNQYMDRKPGISSHLHIIEVDPRVVKISPRTGDIFERKKDTSRWRILSTDPDTMGRILCNVGRVV